MPDQTVEELFTYHVRLVLDNEEELYRARTELAADALANVRYWPAAGSDFAVERATCDLGDLLRDWCEELAGLGGAAYGQRELPMMAKEMIGLALAHVDWIALASYMAEAREEA